MEKSSFKFKQSINNFTILKTYREDMEYATHISPRLIS